MDQKTKEHFSGTLGFQKTASNQKPTNGTIKIKPATTKAWMSWGVPKNLLNQQKKKK